MISRLQSEYTGRVAEIWLEGNLNAHCFIPAQYWRDNFELVKELLGQAEVYVYEDDRQIQGFIGLNDEYIEIKDMDYGIFCMDIMEHPENYENKTLKLKAQVIGRDKILKNGFVFGRQAMVCCSEDTQLLGLVCVSPLADKLIPHEWLTLEGTIAVEFDDSIQSQIPILYVDKIEPAKPLDNDYVTFD